MQFGFNVFLLGIYCAPGSLCELSTPAQDAFWEAETARICPRPRGVNPKQEQALRRGRGFCWNQNPSLLSRTNRLRRFCHRSPGGAMGTKLLKRRSGWSRGCRGSRWPSTWALGPCHRFPLVLSNLPAVQHCQAAVVQTAAKNERKTKRKEIYSYTHTHSELIYSSVRTHFVIKLITSLIFSTWLQAATLIPFNKHVTGEQQLKTPDKPLQFPSFTLSA